MILYVSCKPAIEKSNCKMLCDETDNWKFYGKTKNLYAFQKKFTLESKIDSSI